MPPAAAISALLLTQKAEIKAVKLPVGPFTLDKAKAILKKKEQPDQIISYLAKHVTYHVLGYSAGKAGTENKHELPPPHDNLLFFGDCILVASKDPESYALPVSITPDDYETFYTKAFGGFEDLDESDEEEDYEEVDAADDAAGPEEGKEFDDVDAEEEEDEEDDEDDEEDDAEAEGEADGDEDAPVAPVAKPAAKKRPARKAAKAVDPTAAFAIYMALSPDEELKEDAAADTAPHRQACLKTLKDLFNGYLSEVETLESAIYKGALAEATVKHVAKSWTNPPFVYLYQGYARHIAANFHPNSYVKNKELWQQFKDGHITVEDLAKKTTYELYPSRWKESFDNQQTREKTQLEGNRAMATDQFLCTRCWKRECTYYEMQTRSADEPMTIFITCVNCGKHWRQ